MPWICTQWICAYVIQYMIKHQVIQLLTTCLLIHWHWAFDYWRQSYVFTYKNKPFFYFCVLGPFFLVWSFVNTIAWVYGSTQALPWGTVLLLGTLWAVCKQILELFFILKLFFTALTSDTSPISSSVDRINLKMIRPICDRTEHCT